MGKHSSAKLLSLADHFETQALFALAAPPGLSSSLMQEIKRLTGASPTDEQWTSWLNTNSTVLNDQFLRGYWGYYDNTSSRLQGTKYTEGKSVFLTTSSRPFPEFSVSSQAILRASPPIPTLWLWVAEVSDVNSPFPIPKELAHEAWLVDALKSLFQIPIDLAAVFIRKNKPTIDKVRALFHRSPKLLGSGVDGMAFDIGGGRVLKVFRDRGSFTKAVEAINRLHKAPQLAKTEAMIYDVGSLGKLYGDQGIDIYYYVIEKMIPIRGSELSEAERPLVALRQYVFDRMAMRREEWHDIKKKMSDPSQFGLIKEEVGQAAREMADIMRIAHADRVEAVERIIPGLRKSWLASFVEELMMKRLTGRSDLHIGNLGVTTFGDLRYFDPAHGESDLSGSSATTSGVDTGRG